MSGQWTDSARLVRAYLFLCYCEAMESQQETYAPSVKAISIVLFAVVAFLFLYQNIAKPLFAPANLFSDYQSYHFAALALRKGEDPYSIDTLIKLANPVDKQIAKSVAPYRHSLLELIPVLPLTFLDYADAKRLWILFIGATVAGSLWMLMRWFLPWKPLAPPSLAVGSLLLLFTPLVYSMEIHQINTALLLLILAGCLALRKQKGLLAALLFALAIQSKFFLGAIILALILLKRYRVATMTALFAVVLFLFPFFFFPGTFAGFNATVVHEITSGTFTDNPLNPIAGAGTAAAFKNVSLNGAATRLFTDQTTVTPLAVLSSVAWIRYTGMALFLASLGLIWWKVRRSDAQPFALTFVSSLIVGTWFFLASPITWQHHLVFVLLFIPALLRRGEYVVNKLPAVLLLVGVLGMSVIAAPPIGSAMVVRHLISLAPFAGLGCFLAGAWIVFLRSTKQPQTPQSA